MLDSTTAQIIQEVSMNQAPSMTGNHLTGAFVDQVLAPCEVPVFGTDFHGRLNC